MNKTALLGAAFLMATSAIGPGFLTQTASFTATLLASFAFVIFISIILDIGAQLNIWRIICISGKRGQDIANMLFGGLGHFIAFLVVLGGFVFNMGNIAGAALALHLLFDMNLATAAILSACIASFLFLFKKALNLVDKLIILAGFLMIIITAYLAYSTKPPLTAVLVQTFMPEKIDVLAIITLVGGTVGGYIVFSGAHRLLDAKLSGKENLAHIDRAAISGILLTALMRILLFLAVLGVLSQGFKPDMSNPVGSVFYQALGNVGLVFFAVVLFLAALSSVIGAAYTSVSFLLSFHSLIEKYRNSITIFFIILSSLIFALLGKSPTTLLIFAGTLNGFILPITLLVMLRAAYKKDIVKDYKHPKIMTIFGLFIVLLMSALAFLSLMRYF